MKALVVLKNDKKLPNKLGNSLANRIKDIEPVNGMINPNFAHKDYDFVTVCDRELKSEKDAREFGGDMFSRFKNKVSVLEINVDKHNDAIMEGVHMAAYTFNKYKTGPEDVKLSTDAVFVPGSKVKTGIASSVNWSRDFVSEPGNELYPEEYAYRIEQELSKLGVGVKVISQRQLEKFGMNLLLSVGQGSAKDSYVVVMEYLNGKEGEQPIALVGKGVTFDTGGISLKPGRGMGDMKYDMGGSAAVVGAMHAIADKKLKKNVVGIVGLVENMPDGKAIKPGDVVTSLSGQTVENLNTDAEGRLVLADILTHVQRKYNPYVIIDLATLTGAIVATLGHEMAGLFTNATDLEFAIEDAGKLAGEGFYRMPMGKNFAKMIESPIADMQNIGGPYAGSTTAAEFLYKFVDSKTAWAHLDIAGMAWEDSGKSVTPKGAAGFGVRTLFNFVNNAPNKQSLAIDKDMDY